MTADTKGEEYTWDYFDSENCLEFAARSSCSRMHEDSVILPQEEPGLTWTQLPSSFYPSKCVQVIDYNHTRPLPSDNVLCSQMDFTTAESPVSCRPRDLKMGGPVRRRNCENVSDKRTMQGGSRCIVSNFCESASDDNIKRILLHLFGKIVDKKGIRTVCVETVMNKKKGVRERLAFVSFVSESDCDKVVEEYRESDVIRVVKKRNTAKDVHWSKNFVLSKTCAFLTRLKQH